MGEASAVDALEKKAYDILETEADRIDAAMIKKVKGKRSISGHYPKRRQVVTIIHNFYVDLFYRRIPCKEL